MDDVDMSAAPLRHELVIEPRPSSRRVWFGEVWAHREVFSMLARKDFQTRYKRAAFGVLWAVAVPLLQGLVLAVVFSRVIRLNTTEGFGAYVFGGVIAYSYFSATVSQSVTAIVDGAGMTDKVWFPRVLLVLVPAMSNFVSLAVSIVVFIGTLPFLGVTPGPRLLLLLPAIALLVGLAVGLSLVTSALHVYYRDVKFMLQAVLLLWLYVTPIIYPKELLGRLASWADFNPLTGIVTLFHLATLGGDESWTRPVAVSIVVTIVLVVIGLEAQRRRDRLFVDLL